MNGSLIQAIPDNLKQHAFSCRIVCYIAVIIRILNGLELMTKIRSVAHAKQLSISDSINVDSFATRSIFRILSMAAAWAVLGLVEGGYIGLVKDEGMTMLIAQTIAGLIVLVLVGTLLGCIFNRAIESLVGGFAGFLMGLVVLPSVQINDLVPAPAVALIMGGFLGATCWPLLTITKRVVSILFGLTFGSRISDGAA